MDTDVPNLQCFDIPNGPIEKLQALQHGWTAILTDSTVTLLGPDHESFMTFDSTNIISIGEYQLKAKDKQVIANLMAWISPSVIEVFRFKQGYREL